MLRIRLEMRNYVPLILTPRTPDGLGRALGKAHRRYSSFVNLGLRVTGHLIQSRFASVVVDEARCAELGVRAAGLDDCHAAAEGGRRAAPSRPFGKSEIMVVFLLCRHDDAVRRPAPENLPLTRHQALISLINSRHCQAGPLTKLDET